MQAQFQSAMIKNKTYKEKGLLKKKSFIGETVWIFQTKKIKKSVPPMGNKTKEPQDPEGKNWTWTM